MPLWPTRSWTHDHLDSNSSSEDSQAPEAGNGDSNTAPLMGVGCIRSGIFLRDFHWSIYIYICIYT